jgi:hypothetical protein
MRKLEVLRVMVLTVILAALALPAGAPYLVFLALGGALLAFLAGAPSFTVPPELALALFIAPLSRYSNFLSLGVRLADDPLGTGRGTCRWVTQRVTKIRGDYTRSNVAQV